MFLLEFNVQILESGIHLDTQRWKKGVNKRMVWT